MNSVGWFFSRSLHTSSGRQPWRPKAFTTVRMAGKMYLHRTRVHPAHLLPLCGDSYKLGYYVKSLIVADATTFVKSINLYRLYINGHIFSVEQTA